MIFKNINVTSAFQYFSSLFNMQVKSLICKAVDHMSFTGMYWLIKVKIGCVFFNSPKTAGHKWICKLT